MCTNKLLYNSKLLFKREEHQSESSRGQGSTQQWTANQTPRHTYICGYVSCAEVEAPRRAQ